MKNSLRIASVCSAFIAASASVSVWADNNVNHGANLASGHAPIGVMGDHRHSQGEIMFSYRAMRMDMEGNRVGDERVSTSDIVGSMMAPGQFMVAPTRMPMTMHMVGMMYGVSDRVTLSAMGSFVESDMDHVMRNGNTFRTESSGVGDVKLGALIGILDRGAHKLHLNVGVSLPTGSTTERDDTPAQLDALLPYPMQLGSGTYDLLPGITYVARIGQRTSMGAQVTATIRLDENDEGYTLGDRLGLTSWVARDLSDQLSVSARLNLLDWDNISGSNDQLNPMMVQTANTDLQAGTRLDLSLGLNYAFSNGHRLAFEYARPIDQDLDGPQLETDATYTIGWQKAF
ncbi:transporter [Arenicella xantha]|uniref:Outer membrane beta-barrel porin/alpha-amylase n=1 Tax=Arenicella xantha TaxID=644221 RepID=A0A395JKM8_9GAMM|nr:transporter [Arenicella xantha]RBP51343.1 hypothetical protein DFR28_102763 [Arenicella xantha]